MAKIIKDKESYDTQISEIKDFLEEIQKEEKGVKDKEMFKKLKLNISILINECIKLREYAETLEADNNRLRKMLFNEIEKENFNHISIRCNSPDDSTENFGVV